MVKDGWHKVYDCEVYVEDGYMVRAMKRDPNGYWVSAYLYARITRNLWSNVSGHYQLSLSALRSGINRGTYRIM